MKVFLDDIRIPMDCISYMHRRIGRENLLYQEHWRIVRNYEEFVDVISKYSKNITHVSFDHDLSDEHYHDSMFSSPDEYNKLVFKEKTGFDCARWMKNFFEESGIKLPIIFVHSMNPVGRKNIIDLYSL